MSLIQLNAFVLFAFGLNFTHNCIVYWLGFKSILSIKSLV